jgi:hypothetical protein
MKQKTLLLSVALLTAVTYSCKKDKETEQKTATSYPNFAQLKVGNYWVYEHFDIDAAGNATSKNIFDSCYVEKDTVINSKTYLKTVRPMAGFLDENYTYFLKDSLHYIINSTGNILFSSEDFSTIFASFYFRTQSNDTICQFIKQMADKDLSVITPAGTFTTSNAKETYLMYPNWTAAGNQRNKHTRYAENIGIVIETLPFLYLDPTYIERRLVRYHLN